MSIDDFKVDIKSGKIKELALLDCDIEVIRDNTYSYMFNVWRKIIEVYDDYFVLETITKDNEITKCEAYFDVFTDYTGNTIHTNGTGNKVFYAIR